MSFSQRHYRAVSPAADTPAAIAERKHRLAVIEQARAERRAKFPVITAENFDAAGKFFEQRYRALYHKPGAL